MWGLIKRIWNRLSAAQLVFISFAAAILAGSFALALPVSRHGDLDYLDALFTSTSAVCVTGLTVVDTGTTFTPFGQAVILALIQVGGLGVMTLSTALLFLIRKRASLQAGDAAGGTFLKLRRYSLSEMLSRAIILTLGFEAAGAAALFLRWRPEMGTGPAAWASVFHSVSAFCNAGFSLFPDSLVRYADDPAVNVIVIALIVLGGVGYFVIIDLWDTVRRHPDHARRRLSFHSRIVLSMTALLVCGGALSLYLVEARHNFSHLNFYQAGIRSVFQSVTARTAGFNTVEVSQMADVSMFILILLMFVGGAPGSTAGGVKVTTVGVVLMVVIARFQRMKAPGFFGRSVDRRDLERSLALLLMAMVLIAAATMVLLNVEGGGVPHSQAKGLFLEMLFEATSAFGTVGLSTGVTAGLEPASKLTLILLMFTGRVGPMTLIYALSRMKPGAGYQYPSEQIMIG